MILAADVDRLLAYFDIEIAQEFEGDNHTDGTRDWGGLVQIPVTHFGRWSRPDCASKVFPEFQSSPRRTTSWVVLSDIEKCQQLGKRSLEPLTVAKAIPPTYPPINKQDPTLGEASSKQGQSKATKKPRQTPGRATHKQSKSKGQTRVTGLRNRRGDIDLLVRSAVSFRYRQNGTDQRGPGVEHPFVKTDHRSSVASDGYPPFWASASSSSVESQPKNSRDSSP
ncbi:hypothetical protein KOR42_55630 [Thalassoglobus neptunius]|uniref:Uncharacterized protein n=1 Tax=Thalassoglobus neptunius TaxID=1938619 RepID=A0A5C5UUE9_9PLAN|nr:hypothetical protein KOR42_55630 [Thalassoglobus neptunius]